MIDAPTQALLQEVLRRESRSVLMYVAEAYPWAPADEQKALAELQRLIAEERQAVIDLGRFLVRNRVPLPYLGSYPDRFTTLNFLALEHILPRLAEHERQSIADLERDLHAVKDAAARAEVEKLLAVKCRHLAALDALRPAQPQATLT